MRYKEVIAVTQLNDGHTPYTTKHSVKGAEFENVLEQNPTSLSGSGNYDVAWIWHEPTLTICAQGLLPRMRPGIRAWRSWRQLFK